MLLSQIIDFNFFLLQFYKWYSELESTMNFEVRPPPRWQDPASCYHGAPVAPCQDPGCTPLPRTMGRCHCGLKHWCPVAAHPVQMTVQGYQTLASLGGADGREV